MTIAFTFPGQGSQSVGMGKALAEADEAARRVFEEVDDALARSSPHHLRRSRGGSDADGEHPAALMAVSIAALRTLEARGVKVTDAAFVAGHSLGEYSALVAAGSLGLADAARLLRLRGEAMQKAVPAGEGAMAALLGLDLDAARAVAAEAAEGEICTTANDNAPGQVVISGHRAAIERAVTISKAHGARRPSSCR